MKTKKTLAILLAVMMILSAVPMVASAALQLTKNTIKVIPLSVYPLEVNYGATYADLTITGGACYYIEADGTETEVAGHFEVRSARQKPEISDAHQVVLLFYPDDTTTYATRSGTLYGDQVTIKSGTWSTIKVKGLASTLVEKPTITIQAGETLANAVISGGIVNDADGNAITTGTWELTDKTATPVNGESYEVKWSGEGYDNITTTAVLTIEGIDTTVYGEVTAWPEIECPEWTKGMTVADLSLKGGEATVEGVFKITNLATTALKPNTMTYITVAFTPSDPDVVMTTVTTKTYQVTPTFTVKDIIVESITPITIEYGTMLQSMGGPASYYGVKTDVADARLSFNLQENKDAGVYDVALAPGEYTVKGYVNVPTEWITGIGGVNFYNPTTIDVPIIVTKKLSTAKFGSVGSQEIVQEDGSVLMNISYRFNAEEGRFGHAVLKVNGETVVENITETAGTAYYGYNVRESGTYTATLEYVPAENDYIEYAETVQTKTVDITVELKEEEPIIPIIPGGDEEGDENENPDFDLDLDFDGSHKFDFVNLIHNLIAKLKAFIQQIGVFFSNMSLEGLGNIMG